MSVFSFLKLYLLLNLGVRTLQLVISWYWLISNKNQVKQRDRLRNQFEEKKPSYEWKKQSISALKWFWMPEVLYMKTEISNQVFNPAFHQYTILSYSALFCWPFMSSSLTPSMNSSLSSTSFFSESLFVKPRTQVFSFKNKKKYSHSVARASATRLIKRFNVVFSRWNLISGE